MAKFRKICKKFQKKANFRRQFFGLFFHGIHSQARRMDESAIFFKKFAPKIGQMADFRARCHYSTKERQCPLALWKFTPIFRVKTRPRNNSARAGYNCTFQVMGTCEYKAWRLCRPGPPPILAQNVPGWCQGGPQLDMAITQQLDDPEPWVRCQNAANWNPRRFVYISNVNKLL